MRLREGQSFFDLASSLKRTPGFIIREAQRLLGAELEQLLKHNKKGPWPYDEVQHLITLRQDGLPLRTMRKWLRRTEHSIQKKLGELGSSVFKPTVVAGPQELPTGLRESLFEARLAEIWDGLLKSEMTPTWRDALGEKPREQWLAAVAAGIPAHVKRMLGGLQPPSWEDLKSSALVDTHDAGVYARLVESRFATQAADDRRLYIGSASKYGAGLSGRIAGHLSARKRPRLRQSRLQREIIEDDLKGGDRFITLMITKLDSCKKEAVLDVRRTVTLAEAILTAWLGALESPPRDLERLCPWGTGFLAYWGWCSYNPLLVDVAEPRDDTDPDHRGVEPAGGMEREDGLDQRV